MKKPTLPDNGAFPHFKYDDQGQPFVDESVTGLTKREYFAQAALQGILANIQNYMLDDRCTPEMLAVKKADDLIAELNKTQA